MVLDNFLVELVKLLLEDLKTAFTRLEQTKCKVVMGSITGTEVDGTDNQEEPLRLKSVLITWETKLQQFQWLQLKIVNSTTCGMVAGRKSTLIMNQQQHPVTSLWVLKVRFI